MSTDDTTGGLSSEVYWATPRRQTWWQRTRIYRWLLRRRNRRQLQRWPDLGYVDETDGQ